MPQLNPDPWLFIFLTCWISLMFMSPTKSFDFKFSLKLSRGSKKDPHKPWTWPWQ